jgi:hypothetical protein
MSIQPFLKPRLTGARFEGGTIPLAVLADFSVLAEMVVEVAKWKYREETPSRQRVPRGFAHGIELRLTGIENGSAIPIIELIVVANSLFPPMAQTYFEKAREAIVAAVGAAEQNGRITAHLPEKLLGYFDRFGRNLAEGEAIELSASPDRLPVRLTKETRRRLIKASAAQEYTEELSVYGLVHEFDQRAKTFQLTLPSGAIQSKIPVGSQHYDTILEASNGFRDKVRVRIYGVGRYDLNNQLQSITAVEHVTILDPLDIEVRIDELKQLKPGWLDGEGIELDSKALDLLSHKFVTLYPDEVALPRLYPTPEGNVLAEWSSPPLDISMQIDLANLTAAWSSLNLETDAEDLKALNLQDANDWKWLAEHLPKSQAENS